ncbi:MAG: ATP-binding cassette domain-containing protein [Solirubrobacteraceae bacterium]
MKLAGVGLRKRFGALAALDGVSLAVEAGEVLGIAGPNGAGKSTLFDVLSGHVTADEGRIELDGRDITGLSAHRRARLGLARTFQSPIVPTELGAGEVLTAARRAWASSASLRTTTESCRLVHLEVAAATPAGQLDTLARRKLLLGCLLMRRPSVLLLDEPCSGLLADEVDEMEAIIRHVRDETGLAIVVVEHRLELLTAISDRILVLDQGAVIIDGAASEVFADPAVQAAYFASPTSASRGAVPS